MFAESPCPSPGSARPSPRPAWPWEPRAALVLVLLAVLPLALVGPVLAQSLASPQQLLAAGRYDEALAALEPVIRAQPANAEARFLRGVILAQKGETERAIGVFHALTEQFPELSEPYNNLAVLYASRGDYERARGALLQALELQPGYHTAHENLGDVYAKLSALSYRRAFELQAENRRAQAKHQAISRILGGIWPDDPPEAAVPEADQTVTADSTRTPAPPAADAPAEAACYRSGPHPDAARVAAAAAWLSRRGAAAEIARRPGSAGLHQVYLPAPERRALMAALAEAGVTDVAPTQTDAGEPAISLGVFGQESSVQRRLGQLRELGYAPEVRAHGGEAGAVLQARLPRDTGDEALDLEAYAQRFPALPLRPVACP